MIRKSSVSEVANGGGYESLHSESLVVPDSFFMEKKKCVDLIDSAMSEHFKPDAAGRAWFRNPDLSESKLPKRTATILRAACNHLHARPTLGAFGAIALRKPP